MFDPGEGFSGSLSGRDQLLVAVGQLKIRVDVRVSVDGRVKVILYEERFSDDSVTWVSRKYFLQDDGTWNQSGAGSAVLKNVNVGFPRAFEQFDPAEYV